MNSSTSSSEALASGRPEGGWWRFCRILLGTVAGALLLLLPFIYLMDPYDAGRPGLITRPGLRPQGPRTAGASRGRDPAFDAAILGNSHMQLLKPDNLNALTGRRFVSLIVPSTGPKEQFVLLDWFMRHHREQAQALILGIDGTWCVADPRLPNDKPFPFWLYAASLPDYARGLLRYGVLEEALRRVAWLLRRQPQRAPPDGYWDYEPIYTGLNAERYLSRLESEQSSTVINERGDFPAAARLDEILARLPGEMRVVLVHPPAYHTALPKPGSREMASDTACKAAYSALAVKRPHTAIVDWRGPVPESRDSTLWFDHTHYRQPIARKIEAQIGETLRALE